MKKIRKISFIIMACIMMLSPVLIPPVQAEAAGKIRLNATNITLYTGESYKFKVLGTNKPVKWSVSGLKSIYNYDYWHGKEYEYYIPISKNGLLEFPKDELSLEDETIYVVAKVDGKTLKCKVHLIGRRTELKATAYVGQPYKIKRVGIGKAKWQIAQPKYGSVSKDGVVMPKKAGTTRIKATYNGYMYATQLEIKEPSIKVPNNDICIGRKNQLKIYGRDIKDFTWKSSDNDILEVTDKGVIIPKKLGKVTVTATNITDTKDTYKCSLTVKEPVLYTKTLNLYKYSSGKINLSKLGSKAKYTVLNSNIASVSSTGVVTGKKAGTTYVKAEYNGLSYKCKINVKKSCISKKKVLLLTYRKEKLTVYGAKIKKWASSNNKICTVSKRGVLSTKKQGSVVITATDENGRKYKAKVTVKKPKLSDLKAVTDKIKLAKFANGVMQYIDDTGKSYTGFGEEEINKYFPRLSVKQYERKPIFEENVAPLVRKTSQNIPIRYVMFVKPNIKDWIGGVRNGGINYWEKVVDFKTILKNKILYYYGEFDAGLIVRVPANKDFYEAGYELMEQVSDFMPNYFSNRELLAMINASKVYNEYWVQIEFIPFKHNFGYPKQKDICGLDEMDAFGNYVINIIGKGWNYDGSILNYLESDNFRLYRDNTYNNWIKNRFDYKSYKFNTTTKYIGLPPQIQ